MHSVARIRRGKVRSGGEISLRGSHVCSGNVWQEAVFETFFAIGVSVLLSCQIFENDNECVFPSSSHVVAGGRDLLAQALIAFPFMIHFNSTQACVLSFQKPCSAEYLQKELG